MVSNDPKLHELIGTADFLVDNVDLSSLLPKTKSIDQVVYSYSWDIESCKSLLTKHNIDYMEYDDPTSENNETVLIF